MIQLSSKKDCVGCNNCQNICPHHCISMIEDEEGFLYPRIDEKKCIQCGLCDKVCPVLQEISENGGQKSVWLGGYNRRKDILLGCSSGGVFYAMANFVLQHGGVVCGATFISFYKVAHVLITDVVDLHKLQKSKYVQSDLNDIFMKIRGLLKQGRLVLFSGTPCQVKALNLFVQNKEHLFTVEVVCRGVPSPLVLEEYMKENNLRGFSFREKERGWYNYDVHYVMQNGKIGRKRASKDKYMRGFLKDLYNRPSCSQCPAKLLRSHADCTLGDLWGMENFASDLYNDKGVSLIGLHTKKSNTIWNSIKKQFVFRRIDYRNAVVYNPCVEKNSVPSINRADFFRIFKQDGVAKALKKYTSEPKTLRQRLKKIILFLWNKVWEILLICRECSYKIFDYIYRKFYKSPSVRTIEETLTYILENHCSVSRFGDGELKFIKGDETWFQHKDAVLQRRLREILKNNQANLIVCIPNVFGNLNQYRNHEKKYWQRHVARTRKTWYKYLNPKQPYYDAFISRCYMPYEDKHLTSMYFDLWKKIWGDRDLLIIEGEKTRLGVGNDLFDGVKSVKRILCPNTNAFKYYDSVLSETLRYDTSHLILIALGPTATVLASDLALRKYQAIDIGHIDIEYEWYLMHADRKVPVEDKFVNEAGAGEGVGDINDLKYKGEIVCRF